MSSFPKIVVPPDSSNDSRQADEHFLETYAAEAKRLRGSAGAVVLEGLIPNSVGAFGRFVRLCTRLTLRYQGGDARRSSITDVVYTANDTSGRRYISVHNEMGYSRAYPTAVFFYCPRPAAKGGQMLLTDGRSVARRLSGAAMRYLARKPITYVQNLSQQPITTADSGKTWSETFESADRGHVADILQARGAHFIWRPNGALHIEETVPALLSGRVTSEVTVFCQADRWHASQIQGEEGEAIRAIAADDRYHHCRFADGEELDPSVLSELGALKASAAVAHDWQAGDVLCIDNELVSHGRQPFEGTRELYVALGAW